MTKTCIQKGEPFSEERTKEIIRDFKRDGFVLIPSVLEMEETHVLRAKVDELFENPKLAESGHRGKMPFIIWHLNELDRIFCDMLIREPIYALMEAIFGPGVPAMWESGTAERRGATDRPMTH